MPHILIVDDHLMYRKALRGAGIPHSQSPMYLRLTTWKARASGLIPMAASDLSPYRSEHDRYTVRNASWAARMLSENAFRRHDVPLATKADIIRSLDAGLYGFDIQVAIDSEILGD